MKKILASLIALSAVAGFASTASAQTATSTSTHTGSVDATCTISAIDGTFPATSLANSMTSTGGSFSTVCNSATSSLALTQGAVSLAGGNAAAATAAGVTTSFGAVATGSNGAYASIADGATTKADLSNGYSSAGSLLNVAAKATAGTGKNLPAGAYSIAIVGTVTP